MSKKRVGDNLLSQQSPAKKLFQFKDKKESRSEELKQEQSEIQRYENDIIEFIPKAALELFSKEEKGCPSQTCLEKNIYDIYTLGLHWKTRHLETIPTYNCPIYGCHVDKYKKEEVVSHLKTYHRDEASSNKIFSQLVPNKYFLEPKLPLGNIKKEENGEEREGEEDECTNEDDIIPDIYLQAWQSGKGCPSHGCIGNKRRLNKNQFKSHWLKFHKTMFEIIICPSKTCQKSFRVHKTYRTHAENTHPELSYTDIENAKREMRTNSKYVKPVPPKVVDPIVIEPKELDEADNLHIKVEENLELPPTAAKFWQNADSLMVDAAILNQCVKRLQDLGTEKAITTWVNHLPEPPAFIKEDDKLCQLLRQEKIREVDNRLKLIIDHFSSQVKEKSEEAESLMEMAKKLTLKHHPEDGERRIKQAETRSSLVVVEQMDSKNQREVNISNIMGIA